MITILFVHQSADLYGSDRALLYLVDELDKREFTPVVVLIEQGPLAEALRLRGVEVHVVPLPKITRRSFSAWELLNMPLKLARSLFALQALAGRRNIDIVHTNTLVIFTAALWAKCLGIPHVWHVHEIFLRPAVARRLLPRIAGLFSAKIVANSIATRTWLTTTRPDIERKSLCIWNGIERGAPADPAAAMKVRRQLGLGERDTLVALVGRMNRWKGQMLLIDAAERLFTEGRRDIQYLLVGSPPPRQEYFEKAIVDRLKDSPARGCITVMQFQQDIWPVWDACDIAVVPSTEPEPFGLVAVEAMAAGKPVIASSHGGLREIVVDGETGCLFEPGSADELADKIALLSGDRNARERMGAKGRARQQEFFSLHAYVASFQALYREVAAFPKRRTT